MIEMEEEEKKKNYSYIYFTSNIYKLYFNCLDYIRGY